MSMSGFGRLPWRRRIADVVTARVVGLGGAAVIAAITLIFVYLLWVVVPLFRPASIEPLGEFDLAGAEPLLLDVDDNSEIGVEIDRSGQLRFFSLPDGVVLDVQSASDETLTDVVRVHPQQNSFALLSAEGITFVDVQYPVTFDGNVRRVSPRIDFPFEREPVPMAALAAFDVHRTDTRITIAGIRNGRELVIVRYDEAEAGYPLELPETFELELETPYQRVIFGPRGQWLYLIGDGGEIEVLDIANPRRPKTVFTGHLVPEHNRLIDVDALTGRYSLIVADDRQRVTQWFLLRDEFGYRMAEIRSFDIGAEPRMVMAEPRRKGFAVIDDQDRIHLAYTTSERIAAVAPVGLASAQIAVMSPRADRALAAVGGRVALLDIHNEHPDVSWSALWSKVWYEGYPEPILSWQSSSADNTFEPKFSLTPLLFGTIKAAFYAMLFALPVAIMGAVYTAYFMAPSMRRWVKPGIEVMAALPTVILGFLAGLWLAPSIETHLAGTFLILLTLPVGVLVFSALWAMLPRRITQPCEGWYGAITVPLLAALGYVAFLAGPHVETLWLGGDAQAWLLANFGLEYDQRNSLVVGIAMGLAVIPTIFSIAEDAIYGVPRHLINGSLALGATSWQTLIRVVLLTASPGIFSAVMIGFGRAVGETMIVLMATGNTPIMDMNIFEGMRTFSANIAVELPESEVNSTHYRVLFLAALVLFLITFAFNTIAEVVRQRLRGRYGSL